jgi:purine nucleoside phosphorylase
VEHHAEVHVKHGIQGIPEAFEAIKGVFPDNKITDCIVVEQEMFDIFLQHKDGAELGKILKVVLSQYAHEQVTYICEATHSGKKLFVISNMYHYQQHVPTQAKMLVQRMVLSIGVKRIIACPNMVPMESAKHQTGDLFITKDHINVSTLPSGVGVNIAACGPRFYDISTMYFQELREKLAQKATEFGSKVTDG